MITAAQCCGARAMLGWSREQLAGASKVALRTIVDFEREARKPRHATLDVIQRALESAGVIFVEENGDGPGVRLRKSLAGLDADIKDAKDRSEAKITAGPSPASGMGQLRRGLAKNDLRTLIAKKRRKKSDLDASR